MGRAGPGRDPSNNATWALVPLREEYVDGPIIEVAEAAAGFGEGVRYAAVTVRNVHYEPIVVRIDRLDTGTLLLEVANQYKRL